MGAIDGDRGALGAADVDDEQLHAMVADQLGCEPADVGVQSAVAEPVTYDLESITTASRTWVRGVALVGGTVTPYSFFVKVVQSFARSPYFEMLPPELQPMAEASVPWRNEPAVYRSDLRDRLPDGLTMPQAYGVVDLDERSASMWLQEVPARTLTWDLDRFGAAARLLGRLAASPRVAELGDLGGHGWTVHQYLHGRLEHQVLPILRDEAIWHHPLVAGAFDDALRRRLLAAADRADADVDELGALPRAIGHGDACPNNLLGAPDGEAEFVLIDFGFWGPMPIGFDLSQLLVGEVQIGRRPASTLAATEEVLVSAYLDGLRAEGNDTSPEVVRRAHALQLLIFTGLSALPFDLLDAEPTDELRAIAAGRAAVATFSLDLVDVTGPA